MSKSIEREVDAAREEVAFWREFVDESIGQFSPAETARIVTAYKMAERRLGRLERMLARHGEPDDTVFCVRREHEPAEEG
jgi:hypothetical protein